MERPPRLSAREEGDRNRVKVDRMASLIRELKDSPFPEDEHALLRQIKDLEHPDVKGLIEAIIEKRKGKPSQPNRGGR